MSHFVEFQLAVMDVIECAGLFCSALQFKTRYELLLVEIKDVVKLENVVGEWKVRI